MTEQRRLFPMVGIFRANCVDGDEAAGHTQAVPSGVSNTMEWVSSIGRAVTAAREGLGWTQPEVVTRIRELAKAGELPALGKRLKLPRVQSVSEVENGHMRNTALIDAVARAVGLTIHASCVSVASTSNRELAPDLLSIHRATPDMLHDQFVRFVAVNAEHLVNPKSRARLKATLLMLLSEEAEADMPNHQPAASSAGRLVRRKPG